MIQSRVEVSCGSVGLLLFYVIGNSLEFKAHSFLLRKSALDKKPPGGKIDSSAWRLLKHQKYCFVWEKCDYSASFA
jgi:hypothetical protein